MQKSILKIMRLAAATVLAAALSFSCQSGDEVGNMPPNIYEIIQTPTQPLNYENVKVTFKVTAQQGSTIESVEMKYKFRDPSFQEQTVNLTKEDHNYTGRIPEVGTTIDNIFVDYWITATTSGGVSKTVKQSYVVKETLGGIYINEFDPVNKVWEIYNDYDQTRYIGGWSLVMDGSDQLRDKFTFPGGVSIPSKGFYTIVNGETDGPSFTFDPAKGEGFVYELFDFGLIGNPTRVDRFDASALKGFMKGTDFTVGHQFEGYPGMGIFTTGTIIPGNEDNDTDEHKAARENSGGVRWNPMIAVALSTPYSDITITRNDYVYIEAWAIGSTKLSILLDNEEKHSTSNVYLSNTLMFSQSGTFVLTAKAVGLLGTSEDSITITVVEPQ